jgi:signal transduction histidine kinase
VSLFRKVFLGIFCSTLLVGSVLIWAAHLLVSERATESYISRYTAFSRVLGRTLTQLELNTEAMMLNATKVLAAKEGIGGPLPTEQLRTLAKDLNVTHIFEVDSSGKFVRSTNEDPKLIPNLFSFCGRYRKFLHGTDTSENTPIIPPAPEPIPYKFTLIRNQTATRFLEVGVRVDFLGKTLSNAIQDDPNVLEINLYAPNGMALGTFGRGNDGEKYQRVKAVLPEPVESVVQDSDQIRLFSKVDSTQPHCCQCDVSGISKEGEYYYVFESIVSKRELSKTLASITKLFLGLQLLAFFVAFLVASIIAKRLVAKVQFVASRVRVMGREEAPGERIRLAGKDEIAFLAGEFDGLLDRLDQSRAEIIEAQKAAAVAEMATQVSHNIKSPLISLETMLPKLSGVAEQDRNIIRNAIKEIKDLATRLKARSTEMRVPVGSAGALKAQNQKQTVEKSSVQLLTNLIDMVVSEKREQFGNKSGLEISWAEGSGDGAKSYGLFVLIPPTEFRTILSNLINNAAEAIGDRAGKIVLTIEKNDKSVAMIVQDNGKGIAKDVLPLIGNQGVSIGKEDGSGIGLHHAKTAIEGWDGSLAISSEEGHGTALRIELPLAASPDWFVSNLEIPSPGTVVILDDDQVIHHLWTFRFREFDLPKRNVRIVHLSSGKELVDWVNGPESKLGSVIYLVDFELLGEEKSGLNLVEELRIASKSILVTGRSDEEAILARVRWLGMKLIPKLMAGVVPIKIVGERTS